MKEATGCGKKRGLWGEGKGCTHSYMNMDVQCSAITRIALRRI